MTKENNKELEKERKDMEEERMQLDEERKQFHEEREGFGGERKKWLDEINKLQSQLGEKEVVKNYIFSLRGICALSRETTLSKLFLSPSWTDRLEQKV